MIAIFIIRRKKSKKMKCLEIGLRLVILLRQYLIIIESLELLAAAKKILSLKIKSFLTALEECYFSYVVNLDLKRSNVNYLSQKHINEKFDKC